MWHLNTRLGTFWIVEDQADSTKFFLGMNDESLGEYNSAEAAAQDVFEQATGCENWDAQTRLKAPETLASWINGEPEQWLDC